MATPANTFCSNDQMISFPVDLIIYYPIICPKCYYVMIFFPYSRHLQSSKKKYKKTQTNKQKKCSYILYFVSLRWCVKWMTLFPPSVLREGPVTPEPAFNTVVDWLDSIKMSQYKEHFSSAGYDTLDSVLYVSVRLVSQKWFCTSVHCTSGHLS